MNKKKKSSNQKPKRPVRKSTGNPSAKKTGKYKTARRRKQEQRARKRALILILIVVILFILGFIFIRLSTGSLQFAKDSINVTLGDVEELSISSGKDTPDPKAIGWSSSNEDVVTIKNGQITAVGEGSATIHAAYHFSKDTCTINVEAPTLDKESISLSIGQASRLSLSGQAANGAKWSTSDKAIVKVNQKGKIRAVSKGNATITVETQGRELTCEVSVYDLLEGKTIIGLGDSLMHGNIIGEKYTWLTLLGEKHNMKYYNYGTKDNTMADMRGGTYSTPMCESYKEIISKVPDADYIVILCGASDKRNDIPIGQTTDTDNYTFKGALNNTIDGLQEAYPDATILCMTNYNRTGDANILNYRDIDYVKAMQEVCKAKNIPCFDNYHDSGLDLNTGSEDSDWADEGVYLGGSANHHLSPDAYEKVLPLYESFIAENTDTSEKNE